MAADIAEANRCKLRISHEIDTVVKNSIELKRALLASDRASVSHQIADIVRSLKKTEVHYRALKKARK